MKATVTAFPVSLALVACVALAGCVTTRTAAWSEYASLHDRAVAVKDTSPNNASAQQAKTRLIMDYRAWANRYAIPDYWKKTPRPSNGECEWLPETPIEGGTEQCVN